ncbi:MAG: hypothetical protein IK064_02165 [Clostridia bacterium]|nr:hypothetical protein [Clostridia bacterium]MBR6006413.1 hypothetical protein [Clostridia bacterium]
MEELYTVPVLLVNTFPANAEKPPFRAASARFLPLCEGCTKTDKNCGAARAKPTELEHFYRGNAKFALLQLFHPKIRNHQGG